MSGNTARYRNCPTAKPRPLTRHDADADTDANAWRGSFAVARVIFPFWTAGELMWREPTKDSRDSRALSGGAPRQSQTRSPLRLHIRNKGSHDQSTPPACSSAFSTPPHCSPAERPFTTVLLCSLSTATGACPAGGEPWYSLLCQACWTTFQHIYVVAPDYHPLSLLSLFYP